MATGTDAVVTAVGDGADTPAAQVIDLHKRYGSVQAVRGISFTVPRGTIFGMLGPNGAGKTTTIEILEGLREPTSGATYVLGREIRRDGKRVKDRIGVQLQTPSLFPQLTVREVLHLFATFYSRRADVDELIGAFGLGESAGRKTSQLSGGQQQRLSVALALVNDPELVFLDEPTTGLDPQARVALWDVIARLRERGKTVLLTTHYMEEAERLCDELCIIDHGQIVAQGSPAELIARNFHEQAVTFQMDPPPDVEALRLLPGVASVAVDPPDVACYTRDLTGTMAGLLEWASAMGRPLDNLLVRRASLEDVFLKITGRRLRE